MSEEIKDENLDVVSDESEEDVQVLELTEEQLEALLQGLEEDDLSPEEKIDQTLFDSRIIYLSGVVDISMSSGIIPLIHYYNLQDEKDGVDPDDRIPVKIYIDSEGGDLYKGMNLVSTILNSKTPVWTYLEGSIGMSAGLLLYLSGHRKHMARFGNLMYHELRAMSDFQTLSEMNNMYRHYQDLQLQIDQFIVERTSIPMKKLKNQRKKNLDWFISFNEAKQYNMFDVEM